MNVLALAAKAGEEIQKLAAEHPEAVEALGQVVAKVVSSDNPVETAKRAAMALASEQASEEALKRILG